MKGCHEHSYRTWCIHFAMLMEVDLEKLITYPNTLVDELVSGHVPRGPSSTPLPSGPSSNVSESSTCSSGHSPNFPDFECDPGLALLLPLVSKCSEDLLNPPPPTSPWNCDFLTFLSTLGRFQELLHFRTLRTL